MTPTTSTSLVGRLPGEDAPLEMRHGGQPVGPDEALGVARRWARQRRAAGRPVVHLGVDVDELPAVDAPSILAAYRLRPRALMFVRAKAEMEGRTVTAVIAEALAAYAASAPGSSVEYRPPTPALAA